MIRRCMESGTREFGMCGVSDSESYYEYGTLLEIIDINYTPEGRSYLRTMGKKRFKVVKRDVKDGYNVAAVEFIKVTNYR